MMCSFYFQKQFHNKIRACLIKKQEFLALEYHSQKCLRVIIMNSEFDHHPPMNTFFCYVTVGICCEQVQLHWHIQCAVHSFVDGYERKNKVMLFNLFAVENCESEITLLHHRRHLLYCPVQCIEWSIEVCRVRRPRSACARACVGNERRTCAGRRRASVSSRDAVLTHAAGEARRWRRLSSRFPKFALGVSARSPSISKVTTASTLPSPAF